MPDLDGFALARAIKAEAPLATTRLVLMSAFSRRGHGEAARQVGIAAYLPKPIRQAQLYECLATIMTSNAPDALVTQHTLREAKASAAAVSTQQVGPILIAEDDEVDVEIYTGLNSLFDLSLRHSLRAGSVLGAAGHD